jgi:hypothetical protein
MKTGAELYADIQMKYVPEDGLTPKNCTIAD